MKNTTTKILMAAAMLAGLGAAVATAAPASMQAPAVLGAALPGVQLAGNYGGPGVKIYVAPRYRHVWRTVCHRHRYVKRYWNGHRWVKRVTYGRRHCHRKRVRVYY